MNKVAGIGAIIAVIVGIVIVSVTISSDFSVEDEGSVSEEVVFEESFEEEVVFEESIEEPEVEEEGRDITVELIESLKMKTP